MFLFCFPGGTHPSNGSQFVKINNFSLECQHQFYNKDQCSGQSQPGRAPEEHTCNDQPHKKHQNGHHLIKLMLKHKRVVEKGNWLSLSRKVIKIASIASHILLVNIQSMFKHLYENGFILN